MVIGNATINITNGNAIITITNGNGNENISIYGKRR